MRTSCVKNGLVVAIVLLFIGVAVQPSIAVNPIPSDNEEDCDICPKSSSLHLVRLKSLINRVETLDNKLSVMSKHNPKVADKYQELSDKIITLSEMNKILNSNNSLNFTACLILTLIMGLYFIFMFPPWILYRFSYNRELYLIHEIVEKFMIITFIPILPLWAIWFFGCTHGIIMG